MINVENLTKCYGPTNALKGLSFTIKPGEVVGLLGPNGAGKSTMIKILTGYFEPTSGKVTINGHDVTSEPQDIAPIIGYLPENAPLYHELTVQDSLVLAGKLRNMSQERLKKRLKEVVIATNLQNVLTKPVSQLSKGYKQRVGLAQALLDEPKLLILDEPTNGLDPDQITQVLNLIKSLRGQTTVIFSTHILSQVEECCQRALVIIDGELKADLSLDDFSNNNSFILELAADVDTEKVKENLLTNKELSAIEVNTKNNNQIFKVTADQNFDLAAFLFESAVKNKWPLRQLYREVPTLQRIFHQLSSGQELK